MTLPHTEEARRGICIDTNNTNQDDGQMPHANPERRDNRFIELQDEAEEDIGDEKEDEEEEEKEEDKRNIISKKKYVEGE
ncbi:hypothetical protein M8J76_006319 [Diaphorina citri]|nr:hypothetical protein M8J75_004884 [Diaphorina citri]KAI5729759.1 hypothetical protein M8J76_006319 [Diaphorina citri]